MIGSLIEVCLLYTSDAADDLLCVDLGGRRIIKKKKYKKKKKTLIHLSETTAKTKEDTRKTSRVD